MRALWSRLDDAYENEARTDAILVWLDERLCQDDVLRELDWLIPDDHELHLAIIAAISRAIRQP